MQSYALYDELLTFPHILIGGTTGSGKSVLLRGVIYSSLANCDELVSFDLKRVELADLRRSKRLLAYVDEPRNVNGVLDSVVNLMETRYKYMQSHGVRTYTGVRCWVVIDELADVLSECGKGAIDRLSRIARLGRAAKVGLIACTQSPARAVLPARLIQNMPVRVALRCTDKIESRQVIGVTGAELLPMYGSAIVRTPTRGIFRIDNIPLIGDDELSDQIRQSNALTI